MAPPTQCIYEVSNRYLRTCRKKKENFENSKTRKNNRQNSKNKIFENKNGTLLEWYVVGHLYTTFQGFFLIYVAMIANNVFHLLLAVK